MILLAAIAAGALQAGAAAPHLPPAQPSSGPSQAAGALSFDGAQLGMTMAAWKALPPPPGVGQSASADCGTGIIAALHDARIDVAPATAGRQTCAYDARFGGDVLLRSAELDARYRIMGLRYRFAAGRLAEIDYTASIDAYDDIVGILTRKYGPPPATVRDVLRTRAGSFPRVRQTWRAGGGVVSLADPTDDPLRLSVRIASAAAGD